LITLLTLVAVFFVAAWWIYEETRSSYRAVGFNDGQVDARAEIMKRLEQEGALSDCKRQPNAKEPIELLTVKAESLRLSVAADGSLRLCR
jgi:hypothetical protein